MWHKSLNVVDNLSVVLYIIIIGVYDRNCYILE